MASQKLAWVCLSLSLVLSAGCGKSAKERDLEEAARQMEEAGKQIEEASKQGLEGMADAMKALGEGGSEGSTVEPVDFRELKALLPESLSGMKRTDASGEKTGVMGMKLSKAEASYESEDGANIRITITDTGTLRGFAAMASLGWGVTDIDRETDTGYERTTTYKGQKAYEEYDREGQDGKINVIVAGRFGVEVHGWQTDMARIKGALDRLDLAKLQGMKNQGVQ